MDGLSKESVESYFLEKLPEEINIEERLNLLFLVLGRKPGALIMSAEAPTQELIEEFCDEFDLHMKVVEGDKRSLLDKVLGRDTRFIKDSIFLADDKERFAILERSDGDFCGSTDRAVGEFLGYPESAVNYYIERNEKEPTGANIIKEAEELIAAEEIDEEDAKYLKLLSFLPRPEKETVLEAIDEGKKRESALKELDSELETSVGQHYLTRAFNQKLGIS